jgi:8-oxo-dGTP pyrophosphatase MutT (NUDIX family)
MNDQFSNPWQTNAIRDIYENPWIKVREDAVIRPDGNAGIYGVVSMKNRAVGVVPLHDDGTVTLVGQFRYTMNEYSWEIPEGGCPEGEEPIETAGRELIEETGLIAGKIEPIGGEIHLSNSVTDERGYLFVATDLTEGEANPEGTEKIETLRIPLQKAVEMALNGEIKDGLSVLALLFLQKKIGC